MIFILLIFDKRIKPGIKTGAEPKPFNKKPNMINIILLGIGGHGYINKQPSDTNIKPEIYIKYIPNLDVNESKNCKINI